MSKRNLKIILITLFIAGVAVYLEFFFFTGWGTDFAKKCSKIEVGMARETVTSLMYKYENKNGIEVITKPRQLTYVSVKEGYSGFHECSIFLNDQDNVINIFYKFD
jgi:hypothetical protein